MDKFLYILFVKLYTPAAFLLSFFNQKAAWWYHGRKGIFDKIQAAIGDDKCEKVWMHCASLGEFEQGRPLLERIKALSPECKLVLTFFSPSGYEVQKNSNSADYIFYLPIDSKKNASRFLDLVQPTLILFVKYEYWYHYLKESYDRNIPMLLVSGIFLPHYSFFQWYGKMRRQMLRFFSHYFVQDERSKQLLASVGITNVDVTGDTRFDRVLKVASERRTFPEIERFISGRKTVVAGSTWLEDDEELDHFANTHPDLRFIIAPHDIGKDRIRECCKLYKSSVLYSTYKNSTASADHSVNTMIVDNIGMLKFLYRHGTVCYVGGGFGRDGIHNILEAAVYYKPVVFGPEYENFSEAIELVKRGGAFDVHDALELEQQLDELLSDEKLYSEASKISGDYVKESVGATEAIIAYIQENRLLIN